MKQKNYPLTKLSLKGFLVYTLILLLVISLGSFIQRFHDSETIYRENHLLMADLNTTKEHGNQVVGIASAALGFVLITVSAGLTAKGRRRM